ncbi:MAG: hypothetical protein KBA66_19395 [Leptospiraceae bacterium]|nr:hypothetical protein [Leptospiraceae bacterium]
MKFIIKTAILALLLGIIFAFLYHFANKSEYEILKPEVIRYGDDTSSWGIIMDVKKEVFKNIEKNWQKKYIDERK